MPSKLPSVPDTPPHAIDPYEVLSLPTTASASEIKSAYKKLALLHHPGKPLLLISPPSRSIKAPADPLQTKYPPPNATKPTPPSKTLLSPTQSSPTSAGETATTPRETPPSPSTLTTLTSTGRPSSAPNMRTWSQAQNSTVSRPSIRIARRRCGMC